jgi:outer membrane protein
MRLLLLVLIVAVNLKADFLKAQVGAGVWVVNATGEVVYKGTPLDFEDDLGMENSLASYAYADFQHPIPLIPNARVEITQFGEDAKKNIPEGIHRFANEELNGTTESKLNLDQIDVIAYWGVPFVSTLTLGTLEAYFGLGLKYYQGSMEVGGNEVDIDMPIPILYGRVGANIPATNIGAEMDIKYFKFAPSVDAEMYDLRVKVFATVLSIALLDLDVEAGYRVHRLQILASDNTFSGFDADIKSEISGFFGGVRVVF